MLELPSSGASNGLSYINYTSGTAGDAFINNDGHIETVSKLTGGSWATVRAYFINPIPINTGDTVRLVTQRTGTLNNVYCDYGLSAEGVSATGLLTSSKPYSGNLDVTYTAQKDVDAQWFVITSRTAALSGECEIAVQVYVNGVAQLK